VTQRFWKSNKRWLYQKPRKLWAGTRLTLASRSNRRRWRTTGAAKRIELGNVRPNHLLKLISASTAALGRQSRSNRVSGRCLPKTGVLTDSGGDFCRNGPRVRHFGSSETSIELQKAANSGLFCSLRGFTAGFGQSGGGRETGVEPSPRGLTYSSGSKP
jgi:hypothetical protein